jgi:hypothetical protein
VPEQLTCKMCDGKKIMTCPRCKGTKKISTGKVNGSIDWTLPACKACEGTGFRGEKVRQDVKQFLNAVLRSPLNYKKGQASLMNRTFLVLGPIREFAIQEFQSTRARTFDVSPDAKGDLLVLLVPRSPLQKPQKAYLVGGVVREREMQKVSA